MADRFICVVRPQFALEELNILKMLPKRRIIAIFLQYDTEKYPDSVTHFKTYMLEQLPRDCFTLLLVNNKDEGSGSKWLDENTIYLQGDNSDWEFSGWQKGVSFAKDKDIRYDVALLANDSFEVNGPAFIRNHSLGWLILKSYYLSAVIGFVETRWKKAELRGRSLRIWLRTDCFLIPKRVIDTLETVVSVDEDSIADYLPDTFPAADNIFVETAPINAVFRKKIVEWITEQWHSKFEINESTWTFFRAKTKAILNEALLYARIRESGCPVIPYDVPSFLFRKLGGAYRKVVQVISHR